MAIRLSMANTFLSEFSLSQEETEIITSQDIPVGKQTFKAIDRVVIIRQQCQMLLSEDNSTNAGQVTSFPII